MTICQLFGILVVGFFNPMHSLPTADASEPLLSPPAPKKRVYIETYGCQMNLADSEIVLSVLAGEGFEITANPEEAELVLVNTCSVRENAEQRVYGRLGEFKRLKKANPDILVGVLGCMAERLRTKLSAERAKGVGQVVDVIVGPDEYRRLPDLVEHAHKGEKGIAVRLSRVEVYDDITPLRTDGVTAWISVMRGCDKFCSFCVVPFTRGRERSRSLASVVREVEVLASRGFKEVTLLGQNVNSYRDGIHDFPDLLTAVAAVDRTVRVRFTTSHPQDLSDKLIGTIAGSPNICNSLHLPVQSGSDRILALMDRSYDSRHYRTLIARLRNAIPDISLSTDIITGFPSETEDDHRRTLELLSEIRYDGAFMFKYSPRENTPAFRLPDDVPDAVKTRRIGEIIELQSGISLERNKSIVGRTVEVLVEGASKKSPDRWQGRTDGNKVVIFAAGDFKPGDYISVMVTGANSATLFGTVAGRNEISAEAAA